MTRAGLLVLGGCTGVFGIKHVPPVDAAADAPIQIAVSGPAGGVIAARQMAQLLGIANLVTLDMGGTSTDVSTIVDGREKFTTDFEIEWGRPIQIPMLDIRSIGAGGGSIARIDAGGMLVVGTASAMRKLTQQDAEKIQQTTGKSPEEMEPEELDQAMAQAGIRAQPVTPEDQQAMAAAEANDPNPDEEVEAPE